MRIRKSNKLQAVSPEQVETASRMTAEDFRTAFDPLGADLSQLKQTDTKNKRALEKLAHTYKPAISEAARPQRSEDARLSGCPPHANRGEKGSEGAEHVKLVIEGGVLKEVPKRRGFGGDSAFVDWVNFTFSEETLLSSSRSARRVVEIDGELSEDFDGANGMVPVTDYEVMVAMSARLEFIFGFGIRGKRGKGMHFYRDSWDIGDSWGVVCHGGNRGSVLVSINGSGLAAAKTGWEMRLKNFLETADRGRLTRVDFAHDDFTGETYSVDKADRDHTDGLFHIHGMHPDCEHRGNWKHPNGKGRTLNIGNRKNGKFCRVYEKGRELGDKNSEWVRIEVEFKSVDRVIPLDSLLAPGEYLAASYPAFSFISEKQSRIETNRRVAQANVDSTFDWLRHQCGASIGRLVDLFGEKPVLQKVIRDGFPAWFKVPDFKLAPESIHQFSRQVFPVVLSEQAAVWS